MQWEPQQLQAFDDAKNALADATNSAYPIINAQLILAADVSALAVWAVLHQQDIKGNITPLGFFSRRLDKRQQKFSTFSRELLAIDLEIRHFRTTIEGRHVVINTDQMALVHAARNAGEREIPIETRQLMLIANYSTEWKHVPDLLNLTADALSRAAPLTSEHDQTTEQQNNLLTNNRTIGQSNGASISINTEQPAEQTTTSNNEQSMDNCINEISFNKLLTQDEIAIINEPSINSNYVIDNSRIF